MTAANKFTFDLKFSFNWNNKLDCHAFTTICVFNPMWHIVGNKCNILLKDQSKGTGTIKEIRHFLLESLNPFISYLDTGYSVEETKAIFHKMYPNKDFSVSKLALILIVKDKNQTNEKTSHPDVSNTDNLLFKEQ